MHKERLGFILYSILALFLILWSFGEVGPTTSAATPTPGWGWISPLEEGAVIATITGWLQDEYGNPVTGGGYVELSQVNEAGWPILELERKYFVQQHSFAFQRALMPGKYAVILDDVDFADYQCASADRCWTYFGIAPGQSPFEMQVVWPMTQRDATPTATLVQLATPTATRTPTPLPQATAIATATALPTFTPGPCDGFQQFTYSERLSIIATSAQWLGRVEDDLNFVSDVTLFWGWDMRLGAPLSRIFWVTGEDGSRIMCRAFCQAIIASRIIGDVGPHCYHYGVIDWYIWDGALEALPRGG